MAERLLLVCDLHDTLALATDRARLDLAGDVRELDLCTVHVEELRTLIDRLLPSTRSKRRRGEGAPTPRGRGRAGPSTPAASGRRRASGGTGSRAGSNDTPVAAERKAVREWARVNGVVVSPRGRIAAEVVRQYREAVTGPPGGGAAPRTGADPADA